MLVEEPKFRATPFKKVTPEEITQLSSKQWKSADFGHKHLKGNLGPMIEHFRQISYLNLEWNKLTDKDVQLLAPMFKLKGLNLAINDIGMNGLLYLKSLSGLQRLNLQKNKLTAECIPFIANNFRKLVELQLGYNKLNQLEPMMELKKLDKLKILGMEECEIPDECVVQGLATMSTSIETLNLRSNRINGESLANTIMKMKQLKKLYIGYNFIRDNGASLIGFHLHELEQLELCYCHLTNLSGQVIAKNLTKLNKLDIRSNRMGNQTLEALMANIPTLEFLCMNDNQCSSAECILSHPNLKKIQLDFNKFDDKFDKENKVKKLKDELAKKGVQISIITSV